MTTRRAAGRSVEQAAGALHRDPPERVPHPNRRRGPPHGRPRRPGPSTAGAGSAGSPRSQRTYWRHRRDGARPASQPDHVVAVGRQSICRPAADEPGRARDGDRIRRDRRGASNRRPSQAVGPPSPRGGSVDLLRPAAPRQERPAEHVVRSGVRVHGAVRARKHRADARRCGIRPLPAPRHDPEDDRLVAAVHRGTPTSTASASPARWRSRVRTGSG